MTPDTDRGQDAVDTATSSSPTPATLPTMVGTLLCVAITSCAGGLSVFVAAILVAPIAFLTVDLALDGSGDDRPFQWLTPMYWILPATALLGAFVGGVLAWKRVRLPGR
jgi:hypothetical protein